MDEMTAMRLRRIIARIFAGVFGLIVMIVIVLGSVQLGTSILGSQGDMKYSQWVVAVALLLGALLFRELQRSAVAITPYPMDKLIADAKREAARHPRRRR